jgi:hypothetical protein
VEVMLAVVIVSVTVTMASLLFSKISASVTSGRHHAIANNLAATRIQELRATPYSLLGLTPALAANFPAGIGANGCNCSLADFSALPDDAVYNESGVTYRRRICLNLVEGAAGAWTPYCPDSPLTPARDKGLKNIRVRVMWTVGANSYETDMESLVIRQ